MLSAGFIIAVIFPITEELNGSILGKSEVFERFLTKDEQPAILSKELLLTGVLNTMMNMHR